MNLTIELLQVGVGPSPQTGQRLTVHYEGRLTDGTLFDSSRERNETFEIHVGMGEVILGWDIALLRLRKGDLARITIPPEMAYGEAGYDPVIPPNSTLVFDVELIEIA